MARSRDWDELQYVWFEWRRRTGQKIRDLFEQMAHVSNKAAQLNSEFTYIPDYSHSSVIFLLMHM
jgi:peptidyl-dipeptidase A